MADNTTLPGTGEVYASDDISGVNFQRVKLIHGADGVNDGDVSSANGLPVVGKGGFVSTNNSTSSTLTAASVFTGTADDVTHYSSISLSWSADEAAADNGIQMQFSTDGTNWDRNITVHGHENTLQSAHGGVHRLSVIAKYFRIIYTNGSTNQGSFRLQVLYHTDNSMPLISRIEQSINTSSDVLLTRPVTDIRLDLAREYIHGQEKHFFFGFNNDIGTSWEDIHPGGGDLNWQTSAAKVEVISTHAADTSAGLGTRSVEIHGLSATGVDQDEVIAMNGTSAVESSLVYIRINKCHNEEVGTYGGSHQGDITVRVTGGGDTLGMMTGLEGAVNSSVQYGSGELGAGHWTVPLGKVAYLTGGGVTINTTGTKTADVVLYERDGSLITSAPFQPRRVLWSAIESQGGVNVKFDSFVKLKPLTDVFFRAKASQSGTKISVYLEFFLVDENANGK